MRLFMILVLTCLLSLVSAPRNGMAEPVMHGCPGCPQMLHDGAGHPGADMAHMGGACQDMATCATLAVLSESAPLRGHAIDKARYAVPAVRLGAAISLSLNLPPPRA